MKKTVIISILGICVLVSCKKEEVKPEPSKLSITNASTHNSVKNKLDGRWVKKKEYNVNLEECSFTGIGKDVFGYVWYLGVDGKEHNSSVNHSENIMAATVGDVIWSDNYDNFILPSDMFTTYEIWSISETELYVSTDDSPNILYYTKEW